MRTLPFARLRSHELRAHPRVSCVMPAVARMRTTHVSGCCRQLSLGGAFVTAEVLYAVGERVRLVVELPALGQVEAEGTVLYHYEHPDGRGMGIAFAALPQAEASRLAHFIELFRAPVAG